MNTRGGRGAGVEASLLHRLRGHIPVPELVVAEEENPISGHPYAVLEWVEGETLERAVRGASVADVGDPTGGRPTLIEDARRRIAWTLGRS